ncbi:odorant receptor 74a [Drosophila innubila]|uniref:odorant receptor 74a n=1 Tax=Drosophila innubila TaxID=198719 RepID=UPI00148C55F4|nr:odorant receptor 74a [Drosophila innubila]
MRYQPRLRDGKVVPLHWPLAMYRRLNHIIWPLEDGTSERAVFIEKVVLFVGFLIFCQHNEVDFHYLLANRHDIDKMLTGAPTFLVLLEIQIRGFQLAIRKDDFKRLLQKFYADIYVTQESEPVLYARIQKWLLATRLNSMVYLLALLNFSVVPVKNIIYHRREMLYQQVYLFDNTKLYFFLPLICLNYWIGIIITTMLFGELNVIGELMMHLNARFVILKSDLSQVVTRLLEVENSSEIAAKYRRALINIMRRNVALNLFGEQMEREFTFRIFTMFSFSAILLCIMGFKAYTNPIGNIVYIIWFIAKFCELLAFGMLGSILYTTTDDLSVMYYSCKWEQVIYHSNNVQENVLLMKLVSQAIQINSRPFFLTGLKYFRVTLVAVLKIIQGAFSYFTFLTSIR